VFITAKWFQPHYKQCIPVYEGRIVLRAVIGVAVLNFS